MSLEDLYRQVILDHYRSPRNQGHIEACDAHGEGHNPLCGDEIFLDLAIDDDTVTDVAITGQGCSISQASASMMSEAIKGKTLAEVDDLIHRFRTMMDVEQGDDGLDPARRPRSAPRCQEVPSADQMRLTALDHPPGSARGTRRVKAQPRGSTTRDAAGDDESPYEREAPHKGALLGREGRMRLVSRAPFEDLSV